MTDFKVEAAFGRTYADLHTRTNLADNRAFVNNLATTVATGVGAAGKTWTRITCNVATAANSARLSVNLSDLTNGATYGVAHTLYNDGVNPVTVLLAWCDSPAYSYTIKPGQTIRVGAGGSRATYDATYRFTDLAFAAGQNGYSILVGETVVERTSAGPFFPGYSKLFPGPVDALWTDISDSVNSISARRGRNNEFDEIETGTVTVKLDNADGRFTPFKSDGLYYPNIVPGVPIRVTASPDGWLTSYPVGYGFAEKWPVALDNLSTVELTVSDVFGLFARSKLREPIIAKNTIGARLYMPLTTQEYGYSELVSNATVTAVNSDTGAATIAWESNYPNTRLGDNGAAGWTVQTPSSFVGTLLKIPYSPFASVLDTGTYYGGGVASFWWTPDARASINNAVTQTLLGLGSAYSIQALGVAGAPGYSFGDGVVRAVEGKPVFIQLRWTASTASSFVYETWVSSELTGWLPVKTFTQSLTPLFFSGFTLGGGYSNTSPFVVNAASGSFRHFRVVERQGSTPAPPAASVSPDVGDNEVTQLNAVCSFVGWSTSLTDFDAPRSTRLALDGPADESALTYLKAIAEDAGGLLWAAPDGRLRYRNRHARPGSIVVKRFTNADATNPEPGLKAFVDDSHIVNVATVKYSGTATGATYTATDAASVAAYGRAPLDVESLVISDYERADRANDLLTQYDQPVLRIEGVQFDLASFPYPADLLGLGIGDRILLEFPPAAPFPSAEYFIEGVGIDAEAAGGVPTGSISFDISPASAATRWLLENATLGALDSAILAY